MADGHVIRGRDEPRADTAHPGRDTCAVAPVRGDVTTARAAAQVQARRACQAQPSDDASRSLEQPGSVPAPGSIQGGRHGVG